MAAHRHFTNRDELLVAVMERGHDQFVACMHRALAAPTPLERLVAAGQAYLDFAIANPRDSDLMFLRTAGCDLTGAPLGWRDAATFRALYAPALEVALRPPRLPVAPPAAEQLS